jgi:predicted  nucleic acid-binding Zn-ribbon protein
MANIEKIIAEIMKEAEQNGEPVTREEAEEMAQAEIDANKECKNYVQSEKPRKKTTKERKIDENKKHLFDCIRVLCEGMTEVKIEEIKTETEISLTYLGECYTIKLTKHRPKK